MSAVLSRDGSIETSLSIPEVTSSLESLALHDVSRECDSKIIQIRNRVLQIIRNHIPITTLFTPKLKIDLGVFIKDQMLIQGIAEFIAPLSGTGPVDRETLARHLKQSPLLGEIKALFSQDPAPYLTSLYEACADVLNRKSASGDLTSAIEGRIFTLKNALIAQQSPEAILKSQRQYKIAPHSLSKIKAEGELFVRECLRIHVVKEIKHSTFKAELFSTAQQLIPFVQNITKIYLEEHGKPCPDNPLAFRNPSGYNHHGLTAATVMESCLDILGYTTRVMVRSDLEPKVTLATAHSIVEVTAPDHSKYLVDPCYIQFHKDLCMDDALLPTSPVLVLGENEIDTYIEDRLMVHWKTTAALVKKEGEQVLQKLSQQDRVLPFIIERIKLSKEFVPLNPEAWGKNAFKRVWDLSTYRPVLSNKGFQEIFLGSIASDKTYEYIKAMGIAPLCHHLPVAEVERRLMGLVQEQNLKNQNSIEALSLIAQLPSVKRAAYSSLLDVDSRVDAIGEVLNAYFRALKKIVNPEGRSLSVIYGCSGADCISVMLATDAEDFTFVDLTPIAYHEFERALSQLKNQFFEGEIIARLEQSQKFVSRQVTNGGASSAYCDGKHKMEDLALKFLFGLKGVGVDLDKVELTSNQNGKGIRVDFPWQYHGATLSRKRSVTFVTADITQPEEYPSFLKEKLEKGFDIFYMKASFLVPRYYPQFLPYIAKSLKIGGWLMTTDKTFTMEEMAPDVCLTQNGLTFSLQKSNEIKILEGLMTVPFDPLCGIPLLEYYPSNMRCARNPGSDLTYWSILNLRKKLSMPK
jgi:hypothetical protein